MKSQLLETTDAQILVLDWGGKEIKIDLMAELAINDDNLSGALLLQPSKYGFLVTLRANVTRKIDILERKKNIVFGRRYLESKSRYNATGKLPTNEEANTKALSDKKVIAITNKIAKLRFYLNWLDGAVRAFEQRISAIQTLSANRRAERE